MQAHDLVIRFFLIFMHLILHIAQNQWLRENVLDHFGNYIYYVDCLIAYLQIGPHRLHRQRVIKQQQMTEPVVQMSNQDVVCQILEQYELMYISI